MSSRSTRFALQSIAASGLAIMDHRIAYQLRPDCWGSLQDCFLTFRKHQEIAGTLRMTATVEGFGSVLVLTRSLDNLAKRIAWIVGRPVLDLREATPEPAPAARPDVVRQQVNAKETERQAHVRKLAHEETPSHDCSRRREILAARAELGLAS